VGWERVGVVVVGHGQLPSDLPREASAKYLMLKFKHSRSAEEENLYRELEELVLNWPRDEKNDPYYISLQRLAEEVARLGGFSEVWFAFNEFCRPTLAEALEEACRSSVDVVAVVTTMTTPGGEHSEEEIPALIEEARREWRKPVIYAWPFDPGQIARLLVENVNTHLSKHDPRRPKSRT
jgi:sirohydrochlorin cobaltochelatase